MSSRGLHIKVKGVHSGVSHLTRLVHRAQDYTYYTFYITEFSTLYLP